MNEKIHLLYMKRSLLQDWTRSNFLLKCRNKHRDSSKMNKQINMFLVKNNIKAQKKSLMKWR